MVMNRRMDTAFAPIEESKSTPQATADSSSDDGIEEGETKHDVGFRADHFKVIKTVLLFSTWVCKGLYSGITGPTVPDLGERLNTDYDGVGFAVAFKSFGKMTGSMALGYLRDRFSSKGDLLLTCALFLVAGSVVVKPWAPNIATLASFYFLEGIGHGGVNSVGNSMMVLMWKEKAALPVHLLHFGYGVGGLLVPLIARPFLSVHQTIDIDTAGQTNGSLVVSRGNTTASYKTASYSTIYADSHTNFWNVSKTDGNLTRTEDTIVKASRIEIPYVIVAVIVMVVGFLYFALFLYRPTRTLTTVFGRSTYVKPCDAPFLSDRPKSAVSLLVLFFAFYMMMSLIDHALSSFLFTYAIEKEVGFSKDEAAYLNTVYFGCYAAGRVCLGLCALKLPVKYILFGEVYLMTLCSAVITFYGYNKRLILWIFSCSLGFFFAPIYPSGVTWMDRYLPVYGLVVAAFDVGNGFGAFMANWVSGHLISTKGPRSLLYFTFSAAVIMCVVLAVAQVIGSRRGDRYKKGKRQSKAEFPLIAAPQAARSTQQERGSPSLPDNTRNAYE